MEEIDSLLGLLFFLTEPAPDSLSVVATAPSFV
jgi:hypothetical protein